MGMPLVIIFGSNVIYSNTKTNETSNLRTQSNARKEGKSRCSNERIV